jgi:hypothetical protein
MNIGTTLTNKKYRRSKYSFTIVAVCDESVSSTPNALQYGESLRALQRMHMHMNQWDTHTDDLWLILIEPKASP